jgi:hypothetical protein
MPDHIVVGVINNCEPKHVEETVSSAGLNKDRLRVLTSEDESPKYLNSPISFIHVWEAMSENSFADDMTRGTGVIPDFGGTSVPGIDDEGGTLGAFLHPEVLDHMDGVEIPPGDAERYNDAIEDGRCVVVYTCDGDAPGAQAAMQKAGVNDVKVF